MARALRENQEYNEQELVVERSDGSRRIALAHANPFFDESGQLAGAVNILVDVTERKQSDEASRQSEERLRNIFNQTTAGIAQVDLTGRFVLVNQRFCNITGYSAEQLRDKTCTDITHPDDQACNDARFLESLRERKPYVIEKRYVRPDGSQAWVRNNVSEITDGEGRLQHMLAICLDISDQKQTESLLRQSRAQLESELTDTRLLQRISTELIHEENIEGLYKRLVDAAVAIMDSDHASMQMLYAERGKGGELRLLASHGLNAQAALFWQWVSVDSGSTCGEALRLGRRVIVPDVEQCDFIAGRAHLATYLQAGIHAAQSTPLLSRDGKVVGMISTHWRKPHQPSEHGLRQLDILARQAADLIERRRVQDALRQQTESLKDADRRKDEFLATLAHELRNPLAPLRSGLQVMKLAKNDVAAVEQARAMMERQLGQLVRLVDDLLDVSRISRGTIELRKERIELTALIDTALEACAPLLKQHGHELMVTLPEEPVYVDADKTRLAQALCNLLNNAAKYTEKGGRILLTAECREHTIILSVKDNGIGIPADMLPKVFDLFMQVDRSLEKSHSGLGIGLTIVKRLIKMHGGSIEAKSDGHGQGSEFRIRLPIAASPAVPRPAEPDGVPAGPPPRRRVLVVDDNVDVAQSLAMMLQMMGNEVHMAHDGHQGVEAAAALRPDVILLDIGMPKLNGYEACRRIRQEPWGQGIVLAALTGWGQDEDKRRSQEAGFDVHLVKPVKPSALEKVLAQVPPARV